MGGSIVECKHCRNTDCKAFYIEDRGNQKALMCGVCGKWQKWVGKTELRALLAQGVSVVKSQNNASLDKKISNNNNKNIQENALICSVCGNKKFEKKQVSIHTGLYCTQCGRWLKWVKKG